VEFNAGSFKTPMNGVVEDLLKQLPGVEVDGDGNITINGKKVSKITVDGKDFFGSDFKITSKNLPKDIIDKVQVVDNKSREAQFNKTSDGTEDKAINLTLKKGKNKGVFGRASAGYGSDSRYEAAANLNYFSSLQQISFIGFANNTNRSNAAGGDGGINKGVSSFGRSGSGITETKAGGVNFSHEFSKKLRLTTSYFFTDGQVTNTILSQRQNILPDTSFFYNSSSGADNDNQSHRLNLNLDYKPDSMTNLFLNGSFNANKGKSMVTNDAASKSLAGELINATNSRFTTDAEDKDTRLELFFGKRLNKRGRNFTLNMSYNYGDRSSVDKNKGETIFYKTDGSEATDSLDQLSHTAGFNNNIVLSASWTEPLAEKLNLIARYSYTSSEGGSDKLTNRFNAATGRYDLIDTVFTNGFRNTQQSSLPNLAFNYIGTTLNATIGAGVQWLQQDNQSINEKNSLAQHYTNLFPSATISYRLSQTGNININYMGQSQQPSIQQLQPVPDNTNTLYLRLGNPDLKPSFMHNVNVNIQKYDSKNYWNAGLGFSTVKNQIVYETWFDSIQVSRPINTNGNYNFNYNINYSLGWKKKDWSFRFTFGNSGMYSRNVSFVNKVENISQTYSVSQRIGLTYTLKEILTVMPSFNIRFNDARYSVEQSDATRFVTKTGMLNIFFNWPKRLIVENNLQYNYNSRTAPGFPKGVTIWNMAANYQFGKKRLLTLRAAAYDLLKKNTSVNRITTPTYIEDTQVQVLQRYFLVSLICNLKSMGR
jgi:hypothetical protein